MLCYNMKKGVGILQKLFIKYINNFLRAGMDMLTYN